MTAKAERDFYRDIGTFVRVKRTAGGISQEALADKIGLARTSVANIEAGRHRPPLHTLEDIAGVLRCKLQDLLP